MAERIKTHARKGKEHTSYLSKTICEEFIGLIGSSVHDSSICELKDSKYYTISLDSTPDISNVDQLTLIVRYVLPTGPEERFIKFLDMNSHNAEHLQQGFLNYWSRDFNGLQHRVAVIQLLSCRTERLWYVLLSFIKKIKKKGYLD